MMQVSGKWPGLLLHHVLFPTWGRAGMGWTGLALGGRVSVVRGSIACCSSACVFGLRRVSPSVIDVSPQELTHRSPAVGLAAAGRAQRPTRCALATQDQIGAELLRSRCSFFWRAQGLRNDLLLLLRESCLPAEFIHLCLFFCCRLRGDSGEKKYWRCLIYATYVFVFESELLFNNTTDPLFPGAEEWKGTFSTAGAVIPCCQSSLYCKSCICSFLDLSTEGVVAVFVLTGTIMLLLKPVKKKKKNPYIFIILCFPQTKGGRRPDR